MNDIFQPHVTLWHEVESTLRQVCRVYGFSEIRTPIVELTELFKRGVGSDTDIVEKEMYTFSDRNGDSLTLRPEGTASVVRAIVEHGLLGDNPIQKLYYLGPMFRHERPQKGRYRQFFQFGIESIGSASHLADVEVMALQFKVFERLGIADWVTLKLSSVGCATCRPPYKVLLKQSLAQVQDQLPPEVLKRLETNPQRVFDHKDENVQKLVTKLPVMMDHLCETCQAHLSGVESGLTTLGVPYVLDPMIVRGLDYYSQTAFEFVTDKLGAQATVCGGGRYNQLIQELGGPNSPSVGFGLGMERLILLLEQKKAAEVEPFDIVFVYPDESGLPLALQLCASARDRGYRCEIDTAGKTMKAQMKRADKLKAKVAIIVGGAEVEKQVVLVKDMVAHAQQEVPLSGLNSFLDSRFQD